jgi:hypothetical protein
VGTKSDLAWKNFKDNIDNIVGSAEDTEAGIKALTDQAGRQAKAGGLVEFGSQVDRVTDSLYDMIEAMHLAETGPQLTMQQADPKSAGLLDPEQGYELYMGKEISSIVKQANTPVANNIVVNVTGNTVNNDQDVAAYVVEGMMESIWFDNNNVIAPAGNFNGTT